MPINTRVWAIADREILINANTKVKATANGVKNYLH